MVEEGLYAKKVMMVVLPGGAPGGSSKLGPLRWKFLLCLPVEDSSGQELLILFSGLYPARMSVSEDQGMSWNELFPVGDWGGIVVMGDLIPLTTGKGHYLTMFHDEGRFLPDGTVVAITYGH